MANYNSYNARNNDRVEKPSLSQVKVWVQEGVDKLAVEFAEKSGKFMQQNGLTTSQIRNFYGEIKRIQMSDFEKCKTSFCLLKPKIAYAVSRQSNDGIRFFQSFFNEAFSAIDSKKDFDNFCELMEAMLAYHKANNGK